MVSSDFVDDIVTVRVLYNFIQKRNCIIVEEDKSFPAVDISDIGSTPHNHVLKTRSSANLSSANILFYIAFIIIVAFVPEARPLFQFRY